MLRLSPLRWMSLASILLVTFTGAWTVARAREQQHAVNERAEWETRAAESRVRVLREQVSETPPAPEFAPLALHIDPAIDRRTTHVAWEQSERPLVAAHYTWDGNVLHLVDADTAELGLDGELNGLRVELEIDATDPAAPRANARVLEWTPSGECWTTASSWWEVRRGAVALSAPLAGDANGLLVRYTIEGRRTISGAVRLVR